MTFVGVSGSRDYRTHGALATVPASARGSKVQSSAGHLFLNPLRETLCQKYLKCANIVRKVESAETRSRENDSISMQEFGNWCQKSCLQEQKSQICPYTAIITLQLHCGDFFSFPKQHAVQVRIYDTTRTKMQRRSLINIAVALLRIFFSPLHNSLSNKLDIFSS